MAKTKRLLLLRHAKSSWDDPALDDFDRPLAQRGLDAAPLMGAEIARRNWVPDAVLVSPALRTRDTWRLVSAQWPSPQPAASFEERIYEAEFQDVLATIHETAKKTGTLMVVGHNPALEDLANSLASNLSDAQSLDRLQKKYPSGALARFEFEGDWQNLRSGTARLTHFIRPKDLA